MIGEHTAEGWEARLVPRGAGRYFSAAFLGVWLCGWAAGEAFALAMLAMGARSLVTGEPLKSGGEPLALGAALVVGAFLLVWLTLWTIGGIAAFTELLRLVASEDRVVAGQGRLRVTHRYGPFRSRREIRREELRWIDAAPRTGTLVAETTRATIEISKLGTRQERAELAMALRARLGLAEARDPEHEAAVLPEGWQETVTPDGGCVLAPDPAARRTQARVVGAIALLAAGGALAAVLQAVEDLSFLPLAAMACAAAAGLGWAALWLARGRMEWRLGNGSLTLRRRFGSGARDLFEARSLELTVSSDSDGDEWFSLDALRSTEPEAGRSWKRRPAGARRRIARSLNDVVPPRRLGAWLARRTGIAFRDLATREARTAELAELRAELVKTGKLGRVLVRWLDGAARRRQAG